VELNDADGAAVVARLHFASLLHQRENTSWVLEADRFHVPSYFNNVNVMGKKQHRAVELDSEACIEADVLDRVMFGVDRLVATFLEDFDEKALGVGLATHVANVQLFRNQAAVDHQRVHDTKSFEGNVSIATHFLLVDDQRTHRFVINPMEIPRNSPRRRLDK